jgi:hypothetical protein
MARCTFLTRFVGVIAAVENESSRTCQCSLSSCADHDEHDLQAMVRCSVAGCASFLLVGCATSKSTCMTCSDAGTNYVYDVDPLFDERAFVVPDEALRSLESKASLHQLKHSISNSYTSFEDHFCEEQLGMGLTKENESLFEVASRNINEGTDCFYFLLHRKSDTKFLTGKTDHQCTDEEMTCSL